MFLSPVQFAPDYKRFITKTLISSSENDYFTGKGITPEQFLTMMDPAEAAPYKVSLEKYQKDLEAGVAKKPSPEEDIIY